MIAFTDYNAWAEVVCVSIDYVYKMPPNMSYEEGASMLSYVTAHLLLFNLGGLKKGQSLLVNSAGGSVVSLRMLRASLMFMKVLKTASSKRAPLIP